MYSPMKWRPWYWQLLLWRAVVKSEWQPLWQLLRYWYVQIKRTVTLSRYRYADFQEEYLAQVRGRKQRELMGLLFYRRQSIPRDSQLEKYFKRLSAEQQQAFIEQYDRKRLAVEEKNLQRLVWLGEATQEQYHRLQEIQRIERCSMVCPGLVMGAMHTDGWYHPLNKLC